MGPKPKQPPVPPAAGAVAAPVTPTKAWRPGNDPGRKHVAMLNQMYNLGVPLADGSQSPADKERMALVDMHFRRHNSITNLLRIHHYKEHHRLQAVLDDFDAQVREQSTNWVRKTRAVRGVLPSPRADDPPRAQRMEDQVAMQELLLALLEASRAAMFQQNNSQAWKPAAPAAVAVNANIHTPPAVHDATLGADIDRMPVITCVGQAAVRARPTPQVVFDENQDLQDFVPGHNRPRSPGASSTSSAMYSALDSFEERPFDSQTTADADPDPGNETEEFPDEDWYRSMPLRRPASRESFAASDGELEALEESFGLFDTTLSPPGPERPESRADTDYSSIPDMDNLQISDEEFNDAPDTPGEPQPGRWDPVPGLYDRLRHVFPSTPNWLKQAPFPLIWEITRIAMRCNVKLENVDITYSPTWEDQAVFLKALQQHPQFADKRFPEPSTQVAWDSALNRHPSRGGVKRVAVYTILMGFNKSSTGSLYSAHLQPISIDLPHRLSRHFGRDRFVEILFPSHHSSVTSVPHVLRNHEAAVREVNHWLTRQRHDIAGRTWSAFYTKMDDFKKLTATSRAGLGKTDESILLNRVFLFAEGGSGISEESASAELGSPSQDGPLRVHDMLNWLLQFDKFPGNRKQPYLKLFSRIALGLSRTTATVVFEPGQVRHHDRDVLSPTGKVMNDGVARMSLSVARKLRSALELKDLPVAVQGRIGSAKGMWILDTQDIGQEDWIETYPSQRKWECDGLDADHRTLEVRDYASEARSARLNLQFIPVLEDRAIDKTRMRCVLGNILEGSLTRDLTEQRAALENPLLFSAWAHENSCYRNDHVIHCQVPFLGGLPDRDEDAIQFLLAGGFDPLSQRFLWEKAYNIQKRRCEKLEEKLSIRVGRSAYLLMVVDFLGVLEDGEVQVNFSSKFQVEPDGEPDERGDDGSFSDTLLVGTDVLVARSPAHFTSDMQKVRTVFHKELSALKDVVIFSTKSDSPLADMLSGGDYDGDRAWVCWDPRIVDNFSNASPPPKYDLIELGYMRKVRTTVDQLVTTSPGGSVGGGGDLPPLVLADMVERSFSFNMKENLLGKLTVYKEDLCYMRGNIGDKTANLLSTLLGDLVDQAKQGYDFTMQDFNRLRVELLEGFRQGTPAAPRLEKPAYKCSSRSARAKKAGHIVDYLKFDVAKPIIRRELRALSDMREATSHRDRNGSGRAGEGPQRQDNNYWDADLAAPAKDFEALAQKSAVCYAIFEALKSDIRDVCKSWEKEIRQWSSGKPGGGADTFDDPGFRQRFLQLYQQWCDIAVRVPAMAPLAMPTASTASPAAKIKKKVLPIVDLDVSSETIPWILQQGYLADQEYSLWALIRASQAFRMLYRRGIVWRLAGRQLQVIKAMMTGQKHNGLGGAKVFMTPLTFAAVRPDRNIIKRMTARMQGAEVAGIDYNDDDNLFADDT